MTSLNCHLPLIPRSELPIDPPQGPEPDTLWPLIISSMAQDREAFRHVVACASVSRAFLLYCLSVCSRFRILYAFDRMASCYTSSRPPEPVTLVTETVEYLQKTAPFGLLAVGPDDKHYLCSSLQNDVLYIWDPNNNNPSCRLELSKLLIGKIDPSLPTAQRILDCQPTPEGFVLVTQVGNSVWKYVDNQPELQRFFAHVEKGSIESPVPLRFIALEVRPPLLIDHKNWLLRFHLDGVSIYDTKTKMLHMKIEMEEPLNERKLEVFFKEDFLCLSMGGRDLKIIHLPTQKDYTSTLRPLLANYLADQNTYVSMFDFDFDTEMGVTLNVILVKKEDLTNTYFKVAIPIYYVDPESDTEMPRMEMSFEVIEEAQEISTPSPIVPIEEDDEIEESEEDFLELPPSLKETPALTDGKILAIVGAILFALTVGAVTALTMTQYGSIIYYHGSGIAITLPAAVTLSAGGIISIVSIAVGSYLCWKERARG